MVDIYNKVTYQLRNGELSAYQGATMSSYVWSIEDLAPCDIAYWLPPGGKDNGVWADRWALIADLDAGDIAEVLDRLADADVGAM